MPYEWNTQRVALRPLQAVKVKVQSAEMTQMETWYHHWCGA